MTTDSGLATADYFVPTLHSHQKRSGHNWGYKPLVLIMVLALVPRIFWMMTETPVISVDGSEYVRMAENLAHGKGLVGNFEGPETMYTPLFSLLTAGVSLLTRDAELAAHLVSLVFGTALIIPVFLIARRMYGRHVAYLSAILVAFHPLLIALSASIYNENLYLPLLFTGVYFGMRALEFGKVRDYIWLSICLSLAYLTRPEAFVYPAFFAFAILVNVLLRRTSLRAGIARAGIVLGIFVVIASPYVAFLYSHTGHFRLEGKWNINYTIANRALAGMNREEAPYGLASDASVAGPLLDPFRFAAYTPYPHALADKIKTLWGMAQINRKTLTGALLDHALGSPLVLALVPIALFRKAWTRRRLFHESIIICIALSVLFFWITSSSAEFRYVFPLVPLGVLWVAKGAEEFGQWSRGLVFSLKLGNMPSARRTAMLVECALLLLSSAIALQSTQSNWLFSIEQRENLDIKEASLWLRNFAPGPKKIACFATVPSYYAQGTLIGLPYAESLQALRYLDHNNVDYVVLDAQYASNFPEVPGWMKNHIPDQRAQLIYELGTDPGRKIQIYRWEKR